MAEQVEKVRCPLCEGRGELLRTEMAERLTTPELRKRLDTRIAEILESVEIAGVGAKTRDFEKRSSFLESDSADLEAKPERLGNDTSWPHYLQR